MDPEGIQRRGVGLRRKAVLPTTLLCLRRHTDTRSNGDHPQDDAAQNEDRHANRTHWMQARSPFRSSAPGQATVLPTLNQSRIGHGEAPTRQLQRTDDRVRVFTFTHTDAPRKQRPPVPRSPAIADLSIRKVNPGQHTQMSDGSEMRLMLRIDVQLTHVTAQIGHKRAAPL